MRVENLIALLFDPAAWFPLDLSSPRYTMYAIFILGGCSHCGDKCVNSGLLNFVIMLGQIELIVPASVIL